MGDYKPRLILFAFMKQMIHDFYDYVQVSLKCQSSLNLMKFLLFQPRKIVNVDCLTAKDS